MTPASPSDPRPRFDLRVVLPADPQFAEMVRGLAVHGASRAGCAEAEATAFGRTVEDAARDMLASGSGAQVSVVVRCGNGPMEVVLSDERGARTLSLDL